MSSRVVVTWGFLPDQTQTTLVLQLSSAGFKLIWFDGNRSAALRAFRKRATVSEKAFDAQMYRIEETKIVEPLQPTIINPFDARGKFKPPRKLLEEMRKAECTLMTLQEKLLYHQIYPVKLLTECTAGA
jgi:hypothetical protein